jgi:adhesin/invasin
MPRGSETARPKGTLHGAGKWITAGLTTLAAFFAVLVNAKNLGLDVWLGSMGLGFADVAAERVTVMPRLDSLFAIGDSLGLAATVTDRRGSVLVGANLKWSSDDSGVVTVDSSGVVVARGPGTTRVNAMVRDIVAAARITVRQIPVGVRIPGDTLVRVLEGDSVSLVAHVLDARSQRIRDANPSWRVSDSAVIALDSTGVAVARAPGRAVLSAELGEHRARLAIDVALAPARLELVAGAGQRAAAGRTVGDRVTLRVLSRGGTPVPAVAVTFDAEGDDGAFDPDTAFTDRAGRVRTAWTLGTRPGRQRLVARVEGVDSALVVVAEADPVPANTRIERDSTLAGPVGEGLDDTVTVRISDSTGAALPDVPVSWTALDGGAVETLAPRTDSLGHAAALWTLGPRAGRQRLRFQAGNPRTLPPVTLTAVAEAGAPARIVVVSGQDQRGVAGQPLAKAVVVAVRDAHGNPVRDAEIVARPAHGTVADSALTTDAEGRAAVQWSLGRAAGVQRLEVRATEVDSTLRVTARGRPGAAANIAFRNPPARATAGTPVRLAALVTDAYGNPVPDALVVFAAGAGALSATRVMSDTAGAAATRWTPPAAAGAPSLTATIRGTAISATHSVRVTARR